jgi:hypothetical protein
MVAYAKGKRAFGYCDKTGFRYPLNELVWEYRDGKRTPKLSGPRARG